MSWQDREGADETATRSGNKHDTIIRADFFITDRCRIDVTRPTAESAPEMALPIS